MAKTIKIELAKENPQGVGWFYGYVELPAEEHEIRDGQIVKPSATLFSKNHWETKSQGIYEDDC